MAKTLYHSTLCGMGPVNVTVKSDVLESKFKKGQLYVSLLINGEDKTYNIENPDGAEFFRGQKGRSFTLVAEGAREEAVLTYVGESAAEPEAAPAPAKGMPRKAANKPPASPPKGAATPPPAAAAPPAKAPANHAPPANRPPPAPVETPEQRLMRARTHANRIANVWMVSYAAANFAREQIRAQFGQEVCESQFQGCVSTIAIQLSRDGFTNQMPTGIVNVAPKSAPPPPPGAGPEPSDNDGNAN